MKGKLARELFLENAILKAMAFVFAVALWFLVVGEKSVNADFWIPLEFRNLPQNMVILGEPVQKVEVEILVSKKVLKDLSMDQLVASIDLSNAKDGANNLRITRENIEAPRGVEIESITPSSILIYLKVVDQGEKTGN